MSAVRSRLPPPSALGRMTNSAVVRRLPNRYDRGMMHRFSLILALLFEAFSVPCAADTKRPDPERFAKYIAKFYSDDAAHPPAKSCIVFTGSSSVKLWQVKEAFPELPALNRGFGGSVSNDLVTNAEKVVLPYQPKI